MKRPAGIPRKIPAWAWKWLKWRTAKKKQPVVNPTPPPVQVEMFDDINVNLIPVNAVAVAGYVDGKWPTYSTLVKKFPHAKHHVSIAVFASDNADALDVEPGDATVAQAAAWVKRQRARGLRKPIVYTSLSQAQSLVNALRAQGLVYGSHYLLWTAHYTDKAHLCSSVCGFGFKQVAHATQWTDKVAGKSLDESLCSAAFFPQGQSV